MATFKEIKKRINAVVTTRKTTSAMKMVASSKLRKAEHILIDLVHYSEALRHIMDELLTKDFINPLSYERPLKNVAIIALSSDSSLCGAYNSNVARELHKTIEKYKQTLDVDHIHVYTIGKKVFEFTKKSGITVAKNFVSLAGKTDYNTIADFASSLMSQFENKELDRIDLIYHHFKSAGTQELINIQLLPVKIPDKGKRAHHFAEYILEPSHKSLLKSIIPTNIKTQLYMALLDSNASEHVARMIAMQTASDNADDLVSGLTIVYNKSRQQAITNELLDLIGGRTQQ